MTTLIALAERVEGLTGPDRNTDIDVAAALGRVEPAMASYGPYLRRMYGRDCAPLTASLDAVCALIAEKLPEANCYGFDVTGPNETYSDTWANAYVSRNRVNGGHRIVEAKAATPALALLAATLRALSKDTER